MKQVKWAFAILAIVFVAGSAFTSKSSKSSSLVDQQRYFEYLGTGALDVAANWHLAPVQEDGAGCTDDQGEVCTIFILENTSQQTVRPNQDRLSALYSASTQFTEKTDITSGDGAGEKVRVIEE